MSKDEDPDRPLTEKGLTDIKRVATYVAKKAVIKVGIIVHSGKVRAQRTAEEIYEVLTDTATVTSVKDLEPMSDPAIWAEKIGEQEKDIMLVGHLPHLAKLAALLLCGDANKQIVSFEMAGMVCLEKVGKEKWAVKWMITPEMVC